MKSDRPAAALRVPINPYRWGILLPANWRAPEGFETEDWVWYAYGSVDGHEVTTLRSHTGEKSFRQAATTGGGGIFTDFLGLVPGRQYRILVWVSGEPGGTARAPLGASEPEAPGARQRATVTPGPEWQQLEVRFQATRAGRVRVFLEVLPGSGAVFYDDVTVLE